MSSVFVKTMMPPCEPHPTPTRYGVQVSATISNAVTLIRSPAAFLINNPLARILWPTCAVGLGNTEMSPTVAPPSADAFAACCPDAAALELVIRGREALVSFHSL